MLQRMRLARLLRFWALLGQGRVDRRDPFATSQEYGACRLSISGENGMGSLRLGHRDKSVEMPLPFDADRFVHWPERISPNWFT